MQQGLNDEKNTPLGNGHHDVISNSWGLQATCALLHERVSAFLTEETNDDLLKNVQRQTRISLKVVQDALTKYR